MLKKIASGINAGLCICMGGAVFLACENKVVGAVLFSVALLCICFKGYSLYTGKIGYIPEKHDKEAFSVLLLGLLGNAIGVTAGGMAIGHNMTALRDKATAICTAKLDQIPLETLVRAMGCGILMYLAVSIFRDNDKNPIAIMFCIPVFILSGFEHSIADFFYFACSSIRSLEAFFYIWLVILGNTIGSILLPCLSMIGKEKENAKS